MRDRYVTVCDAMGAMGSPLRAELGVETGFGTTHAYRYGPADLAARSRTPIVLVHGAGSCSAMWCRNITALSADRPVFALDTPAPLAAASSESPSTSPNAPPNGDRSRGAGQRRTRPVGH